jgi:hypothetical protein
MFNEFEIIPGKLVRSDADMAWAYRIDANGNRVIMNNEETLRLGAELNRRLKAAGEMPVFMHGSHATAGLQHGGNATRAEWHSYRLPGDVVELRPNQEAINLNAQQTKKFWEEQLNRTGDRPYLWELLGEMTTDSLEVADHVTLANIELFGSVAGTLWAKYLPNDLIPSVTFDVEDLSGQQLGELRFSSNTPPHAVLVIDHDAAGVGWFVDPTPLDPSEFQSALGWSAFKAAGESPAVGKYDLFTVLLHELGHLAGFQPGNPAFDSHVAPTIAGSQLFVGPDFTAVLGLEGDHLSELAYPFDLMSSWLAPSVRKLPSPLDVAILRAVQSTAEPGAAASAPHSPTALLAAASNLPHEGLSNGEFTVAGPADPGFGWTARGAAAVVDQQAVLDEDDRVWTRFTQSFIVPAGVTALKFTLHRAELAADVLNPADTFEVALLDASTKRPLVNPVAELSDTDALLNFQGTGEVYFASEVAVPGVAQSGASAPLAFPLTVTVDLSTVAAGTEATLYFDLIGFGAADSSVVLDDVQLLGLNPPAIELVLATTSDSGVPGDSITNVPNVTLAGTTEPNQMVLVDIDGDGFDDGSVTADGTGQFTIENIVLADGPNAIRVQNSSDEGTTEVTHVFTLDRNAPELSMPGDFTVEATGPAGASVAYTVSASDTAGPNPAVSCDLPSDSQFAVGSHSVGCTAVDAAGNEASGTFTINVQDTTPPTVTNVPADQVSEAESATGTTATYAVPTAVDLVDPNPGIICSPASGTMFQLGQTAVECIATDDANNQTQTTFTVTVHDTTAPRFLSPAADALAEATGPGGAVVTYPIPTATDAVDSNPAVSCDVASGSMFPLGRTTVECTAGDHAGNRTTSTFTVTVHDTTPPAFDLLPADALVEATDSGGAVVTYQIPTATDAVDSNLAVSCNLPSGSRFPLGRTTVECVTADNGNNQIRTTFTVTVHDTTPPAFDLLPSDVLAEATGPGGAVVTYQIPTVTDAVDSNPAVSCDFPSDSMFPLGQTTVECAAADDAGNQSTTTFTVTVADTTPPVLKLIADNLEFVASGPAGAIVDYSPPQVTDSVDPNVESVCTPPAGTLFPIGTTNVECSATDAAGNVSTTEFFVHVLQSSSGIDIDVVSFTVMPGRFDQVQIAYTIRGGDSPAFEFAFYVSSDARFDGSDEERGARIPISDPAWLSPGDHTFTFDGSAYAPSLIDMAVPFFVARARWIAGLFDEDETNNDRNFIGLYRSSLANAPVMIRGRDDTDRYDDNPNDLVTIAKGKKHKVAVTSGFTARPFQVSNKDAAEIRVWGGGGDDLISVHKRVARPMNVRAGAGADTVLGGAAGDTIGGGAGDDFIRGRAGDDVLSGGDGSEVVIGSRGQDLVFGDDGNDILLGRRGSDTICGGEGADVLREGGGSGSLGGGSNADSLLGGLGRDTLYRDAIDMLLEGWTVASDPDDNMCRALKTANTIR